MGAAAAYPISTAVPIRDLARKTRLAVAEHGSVVWLGRRGQARQLRRLQTMLRAAGYRVEYLSDGDREHLLVTMPGPAWRAVGWWGG
jgi:hypothetical protein